MKFNVIVTTIILIIMVPTTHAQSMLATVPAEFFEPRPDINYEIPEGEEDIPPKAEIRIRNDSGNLDQDSGTTATTFTFDGNGSRDLETDSGRLEARFDFENDGKLDTYFSVHKVAEHKYESPGIKTVRMDVLDRAGNVSTTFNQILVVRNTPPDAYFNFSPTSGTPNTIFTFDTKLSRDSQYRSQLLEYRFDFDGDGRFDTKFTNKTRFRHKFKSPGKKNIILEVRDPEGLSAFFSRRIEVIGNTPPTASFTIKELNSDNNSARYQFDASSSHDKESQKLRYRWDFNYTGENDIQWDTPFYLSDKTYATYFRPGEYIIRLLVKDADGKTDLSFKRIFITLASKII